ncbi:hypothetical protein ACIQAA_25300, partial [Neobacillus sp. NPDC093182]|uniref:hypothetical protein n=1 Tax=Neobacillus sp. NPDC093182 TaxID=3364297 RepID=UPI003805D410
MIVAVKSKTTIKNTMIVAVKSKTTITNTMIVVVKSKTIIKNTMIVVVKRKTTTNTMIVAVKNKTTITNMINTEGNTMVKNKTTDMAKGKIMIIIMIKSKTMIIMNADHAGILVVYLDVDVGNFKRERFLFTRKLPF